MNKYLAVNLSKSDLTHFCFLEKKENKILNCYFFTENNSDWKSHVDFIMEQIKKYQIDKIFFRDLRWMAFADKEIARGWKIICVLEYLLGEKAFSVKGHELKNFSRRKPRIKEFFAGDLMRKESKNFKLSWFYLNKQISQEELNALLIANYEEWKDNVSENEEE